MNGYFGGTRFGGYSVGKRFLDGVGDAVRYDEGRRGIWLNLSMWDNVGLCKGDSGGGVRVGKGFELIGKKEGVD